MPIDHTARPGECITSISDEHGFYWGTIWDHPRNTALKNLRKDPNTLAPGDIVVIPEKREKAESINTGALHKFKKRGIPAVVRLQIFDGEEFRANQEYKFFIEGETHSGVTDDSGFLEVHVDPSVRKGKLTIGPDEAVLQFLFGELPPIEQMDGVQARLVNLGFYCEINGELDDLTREALLAFQERFELETSGDANDATRAQLLSMHDSVNDFPEDEDEPPSGAARNRQ